MLTGFLRDMVYTKLIIQQNDNETLETVNNQEVSALKRKADELLKKIKKGEHPKHCVEAMGSGPKTV